MDSISQEEKFNAGVTGKNKRLSFKEKFQLLMDFLTLRANPEKNRAFQHMKYLIDDNKQK